MRLHLRETDGIQICLPETDGIQTCLPETDGRRSYMETRVAVVGIIVKEKESAGRLNALLHEYSAYIIGRMGIPYEKRGINIVSIAMDAPNDVISALTGKIGKLPGISVKAAYAPV